ncbi:MAG: Xaa-Pro peptidase family protein [Proteobacteria bacterium]|nr:Xaa-Pro peptidase family protein [Pseudomonadota bacterium]
MVNNNSLEIERRIENLKKIIEERDLSAVILIQNVSLYYYTNTIQLGVLVVGIDFEPVYFVKRDYERAKEESPIKNIFKINSFKEITNYLNLESKKIGLELDVLPYNQYLRFKEVCKDAIFIDISMDLRKLRMVKSDYEISKMKQAGILLEETIKEVSSYIKEGITEWDIACEMEYIARKKGHMGPVRMRAFNQEMYFGHFLAGESAFTLSYVDSPTAGKGQGGFFPQGASKKKLKEGDILSIDFVFVYEGYMVDQTRVFSIGEPNKEVKRIMRTAKDLKEMLEQDTRQGITCDDLFEKTYNIVKENKLEDIFMGIGDRKTNYIGHGIGLELDELPVITKGVSDKLDINVAFAYEPKFFLKPFGLIGFENSYVMKEEGPLLLTKFSEDIQIIL